MQYTLDAQRPRTLPKDEAHHSAGPNRNGPGHSSSAVAAQEVWFRVCLCLTLGDRRHSHPGLRSAEGATA